MELPPQLGCRALSPWGPPRISRRRQRNRASARTPFTENQPTKGVREKLTPSHGCSRHQVHPRPTAVLVILLLLVKF